MADHSSHAHGPRRVAPRRTARMWLDMIASSLATAIVALLFLAIVVTAISGPDRRSDTMVGAVVLGVFFLFSLVGCIRWAIRAEHRLRDAEERPRGGLEKAWHASTRRGHYGPVSAALGLLLFGGFTLGCTIGAISDHAQGTRSAYVQNHGVLSPGTVTGVVNTQHCGRSSCHYTSTIAVTLSMPVHGTSDTVAHYNGSAPAFTGERLQVLVDPEQPGYAELPGAPFKGSHTWIVWAVMAVVSALLTALHVRGLAEQRGHRRARLRAAQQPA